MYVAQLEARLSAEIGPLLRNLASADAAVDATRKHLAEMERSAVLVSAALEQVKIDQRQAEQTRAQAAVMQRAIDEIASAAALATEAVSGVGFQNAAVVDFVGKAEAMAASLKEIKDEADDANRALDSLEIKQARSSLGTFMPGRVFVGGTPESASSVRGVSGQYADVNTAYLQRTFAMPAAGSVVRSDPALEGIFAQRAAQMAMIPSQDIRDSSIIGSAARDMMWAERLAKLKQADGGFMRALGFGAGSGMYVPFAGFGMRGRRMGAGLAAFGSVAGLAGFGAERFLTSGIGIGGSLAGAGLGAGLLGAGALGTAAVGMGTDAAGLGQALGDIKSANSAYDQLNTAIAEYGKNSRQAAQAQAQLNQALDGFNPAAKGAVLAATQTLQQFKTMFDNATALAEKTGAEIINQAVQVGEKFLPTIGQFAAQNMAIIQKDLQPFFAWLQNAGPQGGLGIFRDLERVFQQNLPTSIHAMTQAFEVFSKVVDIAAQRTGGFMRSIDRIFTRLNSPEMFGTVAAEVNRLISLFGTWFHLATSIAGAIYDVFKPAVGFGAQFAKGLTDIVNLTRQWLDSASMQDTLRSVFEAHLAQVRAVFAVLASLLPVIEQAVQAFLRMEAAFSSTVAGPLRLLADLLSKILSLPFVSTAAGWAAALYLVYRANAALMSGLGLTKAAIFGLGPAAATAGSEVDASTQAMVAAVSETTAAVERLNASLTGTAAAAAAGAAGADEALAGIGGTAGAVTGAVAGLRAWLSSMAGMVIPVAIALSVVPHAAKNYDPNAPSNNPLQQKLAHLPIVGGLASQVGRVADWFSNATGLAPNHFQSGPPSAPPGFDPSTYGKGLSTPSNPGGYLPYGKTPGFHVPAIHSAGWYMQHFGTPKGLPTGIPSLSSFGGGGGASAGIGGANVIGTALATHLANAQAALTAAGVGAGGVTGGAGSFQHPEQALAAARNVIANANRGLEIIKHMNEEGKKGVAIAQEKKRLETDIAQATKIQSEARKQIAQSELASKERGILGIGSGGANASSSLLSLRAQAHALGTTIATDAAKGIDVSAVKEQLRKINEVLKHNFVPPDVRQAISSQFSDLKQTLTTELQDALQAAQQAVTDMQQQIGAAFTQIQNAADSAFNANVQKHVQDMQVLVNSPLGQFLFGGSITQTPAGAQLAALQAQHEQSQLQKALTDAQAAVQKAQHATRVYDAAIGPVTDPAAYSYLSDNQALIQAQQQLADAQYNLQVNALQQQDTIEQQAASTQLKAAQDAYTAQQEIVRQAMDQQVQAIEAGMEAGAITAQDGWNQIKAIWANAGIDLGALSFALGGTIYTGLSSGLAPVFSMLKTLADDIKNVVSLGGNAGGLSGYNPVLPYGPNQGSTTGGYDPWANLSNLSAADWAKIANSSANRNLGGAGGFFMLNPLHAAGAIPMAAGGSGRANGPTLFYSGGNEDFAFSGEGKSFGGSASGGNVYNLHVSALDPESVDWEVVARKAFPAFQVEMTRYARGNGNEIFGGLVNT